MRTCMAQHLMKVVFSCMKLWTPHGSNVSLLNAVARSPTSCHEVDVGRLHSTTSLQAATDTGW